MNKITRVKTMEKCLAYLDRLRKMDSKNGEGRLPRDEEYAESFYELEEHCRNAREIIQALKSEPVERAMANWQMEIMAGKETDMKF